MNTLTKEDYKSNLHLKNTRPLVQEETPTCARGFNPCIRCKR